MHKLGLNYLISQHAVAYQEQLVKYIPSHVHKVLLYWLTVTWYNRGNACMQHVLLPCRCPAGGCLHHSTGCQLDQPSWCCHACLLWQPLGCLFLFSNTLCHTHPYRTGVLYLQSMSSIDCCRQFASICKCMQYMLTKLGQLCNCAAGEVCLHHPSAHNFTSCKCHVAYAYENKSRSVCAWDQKPTFSSCIWQETATQQNSKQGAPWRACCLL